MTERKEAIAYCLTLKDAYEDYPFHDPNWFRRMIAESYDLTKKACDKKAKGKRARALSPEFPPR